MAETWSFLVGILVGVVLGATTILSFRTYFTLNDRNDKYEKASKDTKTTEANPKSKSESGVTKETEFPPNWFSSTDNFNLETRAIFSKVDKIHILSHRSELHMKSYKFEEKDRANYMWRVRHLHFTSYSARFSLLMQVVSQNQATTTHSPYAATRSSSF